MLLRCTEQQTQQRWAAIKGAGERVAGAWATAVKMGLNKIMFMFLFDDDDYGKWFCMRANILYINMCMCMYVYIAIRVCMWVLRIIL